jgi:hypothetical protein
MSRNLLCIGGPKHGQRYDMSDGTRSICFPTAHPDPVVVWPTDPVPDLQVEFSVDRYLVDFVYVKNGGRVMLRRPFLRYERTSQQDAADELRKIPAFWAD